MRGKDHRWGRGLLCILFVSLPPSSWLFGGNKNVLLFYYMWSLSALISTLFTLTFTCRAGFLQAKPPPNRNPHALGSIRLLLLNRFLVNFHRSNREIIRKYSNGIKFFLSNLIQKPYSVLQLKYRYQYLTLPHFTPSFLPFLLPLEYRSLEMDKLSAKKIPKYNSRKIDTIHRNRSWTSIPPHRQLLFSSAVPHHAVSAVSTESTAVSFFYI